MNTTENSIKLLTYQELANYLSVSESYLRRLKMEEAIPYTKVGRAVRFDRRMIDEWLDRRSVR